MHKALTYRINRLFLLLFCVNLSITTLQATLDEKIQLTTTHLIGNQYLTPYRKELKKIDTLYISIDDQLRNNPIMSTKQEAELTDLYRKHLSLSDFITDREITIKLFALNEAFTQSTHEQLLDPSDYEHNLYITCSPLDKELDTYKPDAHLLAQLAKHTILISGYMKWAKTLGMPTTDVKKLHRTQTVLQELLKNETLYNELATILQHIKQQHLEESFLSFWKNEVDERITANAPYCTNSRFAPFIQMAYDLQNMNNGDVTEIKKFIETFDKSAGAISTLNITSFLQDASLIMLGATMFSRSLGDIKESFGSIPKDFSYYGKWSILLLPVLYPLMTWLSNKIVDRALNTRIATELGTLTTLCTKNNLPTPQKSTISEGYASLVYHDKMQALQVQSFIEHEMPHCTTSLTNTTILSFSLSKQEERAFRFSHPLMQNKIMATKIIPSILFLLYAKFIAKVDLITWQKMQIPLTQKNFEIPIPGTALLPFHLIKGLTTMGMIPCDLYQNFLAMPKKSIISTTESNKLARATLLDLAALIELVKKIKKLLENNPILRENLAELEELDIEQCILKKISLAKKLLQQHDGFLQSHGIKEKDLRKALIGYEKIEHELAQLLDVLQAHVNQKESTNVLIKFIKNRLGSNDLLAAYKIMHSIKDNFAPWFEALGEVDRQVSAAKLLKEFQDTNIPFCFAEYQDDMHPYLNAQALWLPNLLSKNTIDDIVSNNIIMGKAHQASTIILSGPTEGGKSTFERTLATAVLMAQTCGIVPAKKWMSTPLDRILLSFNATDNLSNDESGFAREVNMIKNIVQQKNAQTPDKKILIIIDELFQKVQRSGEYLSNEVIKKNFLNNPNTLNLIVSHREQPKLLEQDTQNNCRNYHFLLNTQPDGKLTQSYTFQPGAIFRLEQKLVTAQEILGNPEDTKNLQMVQAAGLI